MDLRTPLAKARGLGSAHEGLHHWWAQRISAVGLLVLAVWFISALFAAKAQGGSILMLLSSPLHAVGLILFLGTSLYHGTLGVQVVIEDYIHCNVVKHFLLIVIKFVSIATAVAAILAVLMFHVNGADKRGHGAHSKPCHSVQGKPCHKADKEKRMHHKKKHQSKEMMQEYKEKLAPENVTGEVGATIVPAQ